MSARAPGCGSQWSSFLPARRAGERRRCDRSPRAHSVRANGSKEDGVGDPGWWSMPETTRGAVCAGLLSCRSHLTWGPVGGAESSRDRRNVLASARRLASYGACDRDDPTTRRSSSSIRARRACTTRAACARSWTASSMPSARGPGADATGRVGLDRGARRGARPGRRGRGAAGRRGRRRRDDPPGRRGPVRHRRRRSRSSPAGPATSSPGRSASAGSSRPSRRSATGSRGRWTSAQAAWGTAPARDRRPATSSRLPRRVRHGPRRADHGRGRARVEAPDPVRGLRRGRGPRAHAAPAGGLPHRGRRRAASRCAATSSLVANAGELVPGRLGPRQPIDPTDGRLDLIVLGGGDPLRGSTAPPGCSSGPATSAAASSGAPSSHVRIEAEPGPAHRDRRRPPPPGLARGARRPGGPHRPRPGPPERLSGRTIRRARRPARCGCAVIARNRPPPRPSGGTAPPRGDPWASARLPAR